MKLIWECIAIVHLFPQLFPWQKRPLTRGKNQQTRVHKNQTLAHTGPFSLLFSILPWYSPVYFWMVVFFYLWNHPLLSQRWTLALTCFSREPPSDKLHSLCESRMRNSGKTGGHKGRCVRGACRGKGDERSESKWADWQCLNCGVTCTPGSPFSSLQWWWSEQIWAQRGEAEMKGNELLRVRGEKKRCIGKMENNVFFSHLPHLFPME